MTTKYFQFLRSANFQHLHLHTKLLLPIFFNFLKGKAVPLQTWSDPEGCRKLMFPDFMTTAQDGGKVVSLKHRPPLHPGNTPVTHLR